MPKPKGGSTTCRIYREEAMPDGNEGVESLAIAIGFAAPHYKSNYSRRAGRKYSLAKALQALTQDKEVRKLVWDSYFAYTSDSCGCRETAEKILQDIQREYLKQLDEQQDAYDAGACALTAGHAARIRMLFKQMPKHRSSASG
ncbi:MAG TPA: hypothetical protein ENH11_09570 [Candidatus Acetothermia bacterium]|nr:hypothetical protein [Candidatus Acetothermia bacterium]